MKRYFAALLPPTLFALGLILLALNSPTGFLLVGLSLLMLWRPGLQAALYVFPSNCEGRIINVSASTGCTLTRADIQGLTPNAFEAFGFTEIGMDKVYANLRE